jgi:hypothetical protein
MVVWMLIPFFFLLQNDMNLSEEKKEPLRLQPTMNKKMMLINHYKGSSAQVQGILF